MGTENHDIADTEFRNDRVDAGEIGAGHSVTALYQLVLREGAGESAREWTYRFDPGRMSPRVDQASADVRFATTVMGAAEILRHSPPARAGQLGADLVLAQRHMPALRWRLLLAAIRPGTVLRLVYSNSFEELVHALCDDLREAQGRSISSVFTPAELIVPNHTVTGYLKLAIAQRLGIAANLSFQFLSPFIAAREVQNREIPAYRVLDKAHLQTLLMTALADEALLANDDMTPVRNYLSASGDDPDAVDIRRYQLAAQLATLFSDYILSRPEMLAAWRAGLHLAGTSGATTEVWQRRLWLALFGEPAAAGSGADAQGGALGRIAEHTGVHWVTGPELFSRVLARELGLPRRIYVFGFSYLPWAHQLVLSRMARAATVHIYTLNPCMEFWEDVQSGWEARMTGRQLAKRGESTAQQLSFGDIDDTPALRLWGRPGRENIRQLNELSQCDFTPRFVEVGEGHHGPLSMLVALQRDILFRQPERSEPDPDIAPDDSSIRIIGCPSVQRELEVIGNQIWQLMHQDPTLRFNDIAVLVSRADQELYQAHIPAVLRELHDIPFHLVDMPLTGESRIVEAFCLLLDVPFGRFTRPELLRILTHPSVLARYPDVDPSDWIHWSERLGIVHGADHEDHRSTYIDKDVFNWDQGILRLALGAFMAGEPSGEHQPVDLGERAYLPEELPAELLPSAARFAMVARSLIADARYCRTAVMPLSEWRVFLELLTSSYLAADTEDDERNLAHCRTAIELVGNSDIDGTPVSYRIACEMVRAELEGLRGASGEYLAQGVTVAPLLPMRPIPYRVIFVAGVGEGRFPASERESPLDLRAARRRRGDVGPRERDRYLFLETLLSARERLFISYVSRNEQTGETLQPSSVVLELSHILRRGYASGAAAAGITIQHPLRRYDPRYFPALFGPAQPSDLDSLGDAPMVSVAAAAHRQAHALALRRHLESKLRAQGRDMPTFDELRRALKAPRFDRLRERLGMLHVSRRLDQRADADDDESTISISLSMVRRFLECPLQAWASAVLRLRESEMDDLVAREDEVFHTPVMAKVSLLRGVFTDHLLAGGGDLDALAARYHARAQHLELTGQAPVGIFSHVEHQQHLSVLARWHQHLDELAGPAPAPVRTYRFGRAKEHIAVDSLLPALELTIELPDASGQVRPVHVELHGHTEPIGADQVGSLVLNHRHEPRAKHVLRGLIDHVVLAAAGIASDVPHVTTELTAGDAVERHQIAPWSQAGARAYLGALVTDLIGSTHEYLLPCEAVFEYRKRPDNSIYSIVERLKESGQKTGSGFSSLWGPITQIDDLQAPMDGDSMIERRFGPLFSRLRDTRAPRGQA